MEKQIEERAKRYFEKHFYKADVLQRKQTDEYYVFEIGEIGDVDIPVIGVNKKTGEIKELYFIEDGDLLLKAKSIDTGGVTN